jgi:hypothetical protein
MESPFWCSLKRTRTPYSEIFYEVGTKVSV